MTPPHGPAGGATHMGNNRERPYVFSYEQPKADQINGEKAMALVRALRHKQEDKVRLLTFSEGPEEAYLRVPGDTTDDAKAVHTKWRMRGVPTGNGNTIEKEGRTTNDKVCTLEELGRTPYRLDNLARIGVFFTVNIMKPSARRQPRKSEYFTRVAALFLDLDGQPLPESFPCTPTAIVNSSPGRFHVYWAVDDVDLEEFTIFQESLARLYGGDPNVKDLTRVMRLPGYWHGKGEEAFLVELLEVNDKRYTRAQVLSAWPSLADALSAAEVKEATRLAPLAQARTKREEAWTEPKNSAAGDRTAACRKYADHALEGCCAEIRCAPEGQRNTTLSRKAFRVGQLVGPYLDETDALDRLVQAGQFSGLSEQESTDTARRGIRDGKTKDPFDYASVGRLDKKRQERPSGQREACTVDVNSQTTGGNDPEAAAAIPAPAGEGNSYTSEQLLSLLGITWPVTTAETDLAHVHRLYQLTGDDLAFVPELGGYVAWAGQQWVAGAKDGAGWIAARSYAQRIGRAMQSEVSCLLSLYGVLATATAAAETRHGPNSQEARGLRDKAAAMKKAYHRHSKVAAETEQEKKQRDILNNAIPLYTDRNRKTVQDFEPRSWRVGFPNGVWDHGKWREARREDHLLTLTSVVYDRDADQSDWLTVLNRMTGSNADLQLTLQDVAGYALSGASSLRVVPWAYGPGGTGKSTYSELMATMLGKAAETISPRHLATDSDRERLGAVIWGKRLALCAEAGNQRLDAEILKTLSGGDRLPVRKLYAESFTGRSSHMLLMVANDPPRVEAYDDALKNRVLALPFTHQMQDGDPLLNGQRLEELRQDPGSSLVLGFTAWAVDGLNRVYRARDIHRAKVCVAATRAFWADVDPLQDFWQTCNPSQLTTEGMPVMDMRTTYEQWARQNGVRAMTPQRFVKAAESVGLERKNIKNVKCWKLVSPDQFPHSDVADGRAAGQCDASQDDRCN